jgi:hypothetical protein
LNEHDDPGMEGGSGGPVPSGGDMIGTVLAGRYRLLRLLGEGAMGAVYVGEHLRIGRHDAIKVLRQGLTSDAESIARFNRGARNLSAIRHPNVCTLYDYGETADGSPFLALELITGESLKELIERERALDPRRALRIALQTAQALDAAHHAGIVHRDLKPANIMLERDRDDNDVAKVVDFDIAKGPEPASGDEVTRLGYVVGTPEYMSPEQLTGEKLDGRSDIYSLGVTLFRMLTGVIPFRATDVQKIMLERLTEAPLTLAEVRPDLRIPDEVQRVLDRALARDRDERYASAAELARDLTKLQQMLSAPAAATAVAAGAAIPETRVAPSTGGSRPPPSAPPPPSRRVPAWLIGTVVIAVAGAGIASVIMFRGNGAAMVNNAPIPIDSLGGGGGGGQVDVDSANDGGGSGGGGGEDPQPPVPDPQPPEPTPVETRVIAANAADVLLDLLDRMGEDPGSMRAARDTAMRFWQLPGIVRADSSLAAYIIGWYAVEEENRQECQEWLNRAVDLGNRGAATMLELCDRIGR